MNRLEKDDLKQIQTEDGSYTLSRVKGGILYKSAHGAHTESISIFVDGCNLIPLPQDH